jgi:hypothetical protein
MREVEEWVDGAGPEKRHQVSETSRRTEKAQLTASLGKRVAQDTHQIMIKLERYRSELKADEAQLMQALERIRADLREADEVIQAMQPAMDVVDRISARTGETQAIHDTVKAVKVVRNGASAD